MMMVEAKSNCSWERTANGLSHASQVQITFAGLTANTKAAV